MDDVGVRCRQACIFEDEVVRFAWYKFIRGVQLPALFGEVLVSTKSISAGDSVLRYHIAFEEFIVTSARSPSETRTPKIMAAVDSNQATMARMEELREKQRSLRDLYPMDRSASSLSMASSLNNSENSDPNDDPERLARSLSRIKIRRPSSSAAINVDMAKMVNAEETKMGEKDTCTTKVKISTRRQSTGGIISKVYGKTILANYPVQESAVARVYRKTILANYPSPTIKEDSTDRTMSFSDDGSANHSRHSN